MQSIKTLTVYLGSAGRARPVFREAAERLGTLIGEKKKRLVYGGMDAGLMGVIANKALDSGAHVTGIIPKKLKDSERIHPALSETLLVEDLWQRKRKMFLAADAVIALPGGFGTLDESLEVLYWGGLGLHDKPLVLVNIEGYWSSIIKFLPSLAGFNNHFLLNANSIEDVFPVLTKWQPGHTVINPEKNFPHFEDVLMESNSDPIILSEATLEQVYYFITALGLKQLGKHARPMGILNEGNRFDCLLEWLDAAHREHFITDKCLKLFDIDQNEAALKEKLAHQNMIEIDLHHEKWGPGETGTHLEVHEER